MKKILKILAIGIFVLVVLIFLFITYLVKFRPNIPLEEVKIEYTPERIERGKYLAETVAQCIDCHSTRDWTKFSGPTIPGTEGKGGEVFDRTLGFPGKFYASNITPFHLKSWSDAELFRAITSGVSRDGRPLFPIMPYPNFGKMDREDIYSIIAYVRSLPSIEHKVPVSEPDFPMNIIIHTIPSPDALAPKPAASDKISYGKYLALSAGCAECHTPAKRGQIIEEMMFSGGRNFAAPFGLLTSSNITPDKETGIGNWTEEAFVNRFKAFDKNINNIPEDVAPGEFNTIMPWSNYARMTDEDLAAIYAYLKSVKPIPNKVPKVFSKK